MFDHKHYVPILKAKAGELWALTNLRSKFRAKVTPLFELAAIPRKKEGTRSMPLSEHITCQCRAIAKAWGTSDPVFVDTKWIDHSRGDSKALELVLSAGRRFGLQFVPVIYASANAAILAAAKAAMAKDKLGTMIRITRSDLATPSRPLSAVHAVGIPLKEAYLLLDYRSDHMALAEDLAIMDKTMKLGDWKTLTAASGVFPTTVSDRELNRWHSISRLDWTSWLNAVTSARLPRRPAYSDYTIRDPGPPASGGDPPVTMRYTASDYWLVKVGGRVQKGAAPEMFQICAELIKKDEYCNPDFSAGDRIIHETGTKKTKSGGARQWLQWAINHHIEFVVSQLNN